MSHLTTILDKVRARIAQSQRLETALVEVQERIANETLKPPKDEQIEAQIIITDAHFVDAESCDAGISSATDVIEEVLE